MHQESQERRAHHNSGRPCADGNKDAIDNWIQHAGVRHDAKVENREDEHRRDGRDLLDAGEDELSRRQAEAAGNRRGRGDHDECHERRRDPAHDEREQENDSGEAQQREHGQRIISAVSPKVN